MESASGPSLSGMNVMEPLDTDPCYSKMDSEASKVKTAGSIMLSPGPNQSEMHQCLTLTQRWKARGRDDSTFALTSILELKYLTGG